MKKVSVLSIIPFSLSDQDRRAMLYRRHSFYASRDNMPRVMIEFRLKETSAYLNTCSFDDLLDVCSRSGSAYFNAMSDRDVTDIEITLMMVNWSAERQSSLNFSPDLTRGMCNQMAILTGDIDSQDKSSWVDKSLSFGTSLISVLSTRGYLSLYGTSYLQVRNALTYVDYVHDGIEVLRERKGVEYIYKDLTFYGIDNIVGLVDTQRLAESLSSRLLSLLGRTRLLARYVPHPAVKILVSILIEVGIVLVRNELKEHMKRQFDPTKGEPNG